MFTNLRDPTSKNVETFFYRFEFQKRGTLHLHMLVWVNSCMGCNDDLTGVGRAGKAKNRLTVQNKGHLHSLWRVR